MPGAGLSPEEEKDKERHQNIRESSGSRKLSDPGSLRSGELGIKQ